MEKVGPSVDAAGSAWLNLKALFIQNDAVPDRLSAIFTPSDPKIGVVSLTM